MSDSSQDAPLSHDEAIAMLKAGKVDQWNAIRQANPDWQPNLSYADLHKACLDNCNLSNSMMAHSQLGYASLKLAKFDDTTLNHADLSFCTGFRASFTHASMIHTNLNNSDFSHCAFNNAFLPHAILSSTKLSFSTFTNATFTSVNATDACFIHAAFKGANLRDTTLENATCEMTTFDNSTLCRTNFRSTNLRNASFIDTTGLFGRHRAAYQKAAHYVETAIVSREHDLISWTRLQAIGRLRLLGISYISIVLLTLYITFAKWYNDSIQHLSAWSLDLATSDGPSWVAWLAQLPPLPVPVKLGIQLAAILALAIASTIYSNACPPIVKEQTEVSWYRVAKNALLEYRSANWCRIKWRYACCTFFVLGSLYTIYYVGARVFSAFRYAFDAWF